MRFVLVLWCALLSSGCLAWNARGHAAIATLAEANLTPTAKAQIQALLIDDLDRYEQPSGRKTLAAVASWPDEIREVAIKSEPAAYRGWHVRGNQVCATKLGGCKEGHCVDQLIIHYAAVLGDRSQSARARNEALKWVVHLVGDEHMPLHSGVNRNGGSAKVVLEGVALKPDATFHSVWDSQLLNAALEGWKPQARLEEQTQPLASDAPTQWMLEARDVALQGTYEPLPGFACSESKLPEPFVLDAAYQQHSIAVVRQQVERAGLRLAQLLNETLD